MTDQANPFDGAPLAPRPALNEDAVQSIHAGAADIQRWLLQITSKGSISLDRRSDIIRTARAIIDKAEKL